MNRSTILDQSTDRSARTFNALADPARVSIVEELRRGEVCVCELESRLGLASNLLSYHLRILREAGLVSGRRRGRRTEYRIERDGLDTLRREVERLAEAQAGDRR